MTEGRAESEKWWTVCVPCACSEPIYRLFSICLTVMQLSRQKLQETVLVAILEMNAPSQIYCNALTNVDVTNYQQMTF